MRQFVGSFVLLAMCGMVSAATPTLSVTWPTTLAKQARIDYNEGTGVGVFFGDGVSSVTVSVVADSGNGAETVLGTLSNPTGTNSVGIQGWTPKDKGNNPGDYKVKVVAGGLTRWSDVFTVYNPVSTPSVLSVTATAGTGITGQDVGFVAAASLPGATYNWSGEVSGSTATVAGRFTTAGNYTAMCTVSLNGQTATANATAVISAAPVVSQPTNTVNSVVVKPIGSARVDQLMTFEVNSSSVPSSIMIDWGDGKFVSPAGTDSVGGLSYLSHTFANIGQYSINFQLVINGQTINVPETVKVSDGVLILIRRVPIAFRGIIYPVVQITDENGAELSSTTFSSLGLTPKVPNKNMSWKKASLQFTSTKFFPQPHYWGLPINTKYWYAK